ncbi:dihydrofolate reductase family protein [Actinomadura adrarensis]|uniref:Dihydrofolate reductase family protein n=1 Tax=Actinomadura adrarensis TaxID=1819600 RepID=A0ABW3CK44_9ACTN
MRKVVSGLFISLDGAVDAPDQWQHAFDDEMGESLGKTLESADAVLMGRVTWEGWAEYWPNYSGGEDSAFADWINGSPKYVVSTTLDDVSKWQNSHLIKGDLTTAVNELKQGEGKDISVAGSVRLVRSLLELDLLDRLDLMIHPVLAGGGFERLFPQDAAKRNLELVSAESTSSGTILASYRPKR